MNVKSIKKGFTLTELIIVIVIIGILAGVLIPTFINVVNKANKAADLSLIRNLNEALVLDKYDNGEHKTMTQALDAAEDFGYDVAKISAKVSKNDIVWDSKNDVFCYLINDEKIEYYPNSVPQDNEIKLSDNVNIDERHLLWIIDDEVSDKFSTYYYSSSEDTVPTINVSNVGFDVGKANIEAVNYSGSKGHTVVIRTNGGTLTVNAPSDTIHHYGEAVSLYIEKIGTSSYHEFGYVPYAQIKNGRVVNEVYKEDEKGIQNLFLIASTVNSFDDIIVGAAEGAKLPDLDRTDVTIPTGGVLVVKVEEGVKSEGDSYSTTNEDYVYLYKSGINEQILTSDTKVGNGTITGNIGETVTGKAFEDSNTIVTFTVGTNQIDNDDSKVAATQIANTPTGEVTESNLNSSTIEVESKATIADVELAQGDNALYNGGAGTKGNPYLISKGSQFKNIVGDLVDKYYVLINNIDVTESDLTDSSLIPTFNGTFDGNNYRIKFPYQEKEHKMCFVSSFGGNIQNAEFEFENYGYIAYQADADCTFTNVDVYGFIDCDNNYGAYILTDATSHVSLKECDFYGTIASGGTKDNNNAIYVGSISKGSGEEKRVSFDQCHNYGSIYSGDVAMFIANGMQYDLVGTQARIIIDVNNCSNNGYVEWMDDSGYRPYNHFIATNLQEVKEINLDGVRYIKTINLSAGEIAALGINGTTVKEMVQENATNPSDVPWTGTRLYKHTSPTMPDDNSINYSVAISDSTLKIYQLDDGTFRVEKATANAAYYIVTDKTMVHYNGASQHYVISERIESDQFVNNKYTTTMKNYTFVDERLISKTTSLQGGEYGTITINGVDYPTYTVNNETHYYYTDENFYFAADMYRNKVGSVYVSAYDANDVIIASAQLCEEPGSINLVKSAKLGNDLTQLFVPSKGEATWRNDRYCNTSTDNSIDRYLGSKYSYNLYACGFIAIEAENNPIYYLKTKSTLTSEDDRYTYERICLARANGNTVEIVGSIVVLHNISGLIEGRQESGEYYIYELDLSTIFPNVDFTDINETYYFRVSISASGGNLSEIYK